MDQERSALDQRFRDRAQAGRELAGRLGKFAGRHDVIILGLARGGVAVAFEVARSLHAPLDVFLVRKLGVPGHEEHAFGAVASGGVRVVNQHLIEVLGLSPASIETIEAGELRELERRTHVYRGNRPPPQVAGRTVILVDDGLATGATMLAAVAALRQEQAGMIVVAVPVAGPEVSDTLHAAADEFVCLLAPRMLYAVGVWYDDFSQTTDEEVRALLERAQEHRAGAPVRPHTTR
jgi:predicted phosphoribosyltransferase